MGHVTFVIATYRRVEALRAAVRSLLRQEHGDWTALVVGDRCGDETADALRPFRDPRVRYYNLPERFGEQSGPNSAGLHLASGDFVAFLNHDDLLLPDHLVHTLERLDVERGDLCFGRFANATRVVEEGGVLLPVFTEVGPFTRDLAHLVRPNPRAFDPSSFWVVRMPLAKAVGPWRSARSLWRTPLGDWLLRARRLGGRFCFGTKVTGLRLQTRTVRKEAPIYSIKTPEHEYLAERIERESPDDIRAFVDEQVRAEAGPRESPREGLRRRLRLAFYLRFGIDTTEILGRLARRRKGVLLELLSRKRTGESLPPAPTLAAFLADPEAHRVL